MYCSIDRFEVAGRRFPFGGRCSLFENVWKRKARTARLKTWSNSGPRCYFKSPPLPPPPLRSTSEWNDRAGAWASL